MKNYLAAAIKSLDPTSEFSFTDDDYSTIKWDILEGKAPTQAEIDAEILKIKEAEIKDAVSVAMAKAALLAKLGISADEATLILS